MPSARKVQAASSPSASLGPEESAIRITASYVTAEASNAQSMSISFAAASLSSIRISATLDLVAFKCEAISNRLDVLLAETAEKYDLLVAYGKRHPDACWPAPTGMMPRSVQLLRQASRVAVEIKSSRTVPRSSDATVVSGLAHVTSQIEMINFQLDALTENAADLFTCSSQLLGLGTTSSSSAIGVDPLLSILVVDRTGPTAAPACTSTNTGISHGASPHSSSGSAFVWI